MRVATRRALPTAASPSRGAERGCATARVCFGDAGGRVGGSDGLVVARQAEASGRVDSVVGTVAGGDDFGCGGWGADWAGVGTVGSDRDGDEDEMEESTR